MFAMALALSGAGSTARFAAASGSSFIPVSAQHSGQFHPPPPTAAELGSRNDGLGTRCRLHVALLQAACAVGRMLSNATRPRDDSCGTGEHGTAVVDVTCVRGTGVVATATSS